MRYVVRHGDTLGNIAYRFGTSVFAIVTANRMRYPYMLHPGMVLWIPVSYHHHHHFHHHHHR